MKIFWGLLIALSFVGCAHVNSVSLTSIPAGKGHEVHAEASKTIFLGFNFDNDYVNQMASDLRRQCPNGLIRGILTKDETINYFLFIVWARKVSASGYCIQGRNTASVDADPAAAGGTNETSGGVTQ
jgi:hypothetical protein